MFWLDATCVEQLRVAMVGLATALGAPPDAALSFSPHELARNVVERLGRAAAAGSPWLLCIDGVDEERALGLLGRAFFPRDLKIGGHLLFSSRLTKLRHWAPLGIADPLELQPMMPLDWRWSNV